jgi:flagellar biosynthesis anti-sigma factor FlgM
MEISGKGSTINLLTYAHKLNDGQMQAAGKAIRSTEASQEDKVVLSAKAKEVRQAFEDLKKMPDVREKEVGKIQSQIETNTYRVEGDKIAFNMLNEAFDNNLILHRFQIDV